MLFNRVEIWAFFENRIQMRNMMNISDYDIACFIALDAMDSGEFCYIPDTVFDININFCHIMGVLEKDLRNYRNGLGWYRQHKLKYCLMNSYNVLSRFPWLYKRHLLPLTTTCRIFNKLYTVHFHQSCWGKIHFVPYILPFYRVHCNSLRRLISPTTRLFIYQLFRLPPTKTSKFCIALCEGIQRCAVEWIPVTWKRFHVLTSRFSDILQIIHYLTPVTILNSSGFLCWSKNNALLRNRLKNKTHGTLYCLNHKWYVYVGYIFSFTHLFAI